MGRIFADATPEQERDYVEKRRKDAFLLFCRSPVLWRMHASSHMRAANILYDIAYEASVRDMTRFNARADAAFKDGLPNSSGSRSMDERELSDFADELLLGDFFLLAGYALECVLKGSLLAKRPELVKDEKQLDELVVTHNLCQLCEECGIELLSEEWDLLELMTDHLRWRKYPVPKKIRNMPSSDDPDHRAPLSPFREKKAQTLANGVFLRGLASLSSLGNAKP